MAIKADLAKLLEFVTDEDQEKTVSLSRETVFIALVALQHSKMSYRGHWLNDGEDLTDAEWDQALEFVDRAYEELMQVSEVTQQSQLLAETDSLLIKVDFPLSPP